MVKVLFYVLFFLGGLNFGFAQEVYQAHTHVQMVSEQDAVIKGEAFWVGVDFVMDEGWHIYWQNPGDSGLAPKIKWQKYQLASGVRIGKIQWPYPETLNEGPLTSYGFEHEVILLVPFSIDKNFGPSKEINLQASLAWLACKDVCIPGKAKISLTLPVVEKTPVSFNHFKTSFDQTRQNLPLEITSMTSRANLDKNQWHVDIHTPFKPKGEIIFYPFRDDLIEHSAPQQAHVTKDGYRLVLSKSHLYHGSLKHLEGVAVNQSGWQQNSPSKALFIHAPIDTAVPQTPFLLACIFALIGGLILNLMPCVLPVLSIKVLHLLERHPDKKIALRHSLIYSLGILVSVWALALLLFILKAAGQFAGWGFQFQSPVFVIMVAVILFVLALNLFGVFEFSSPFIGGLPVRQGGYWASFMSGVITTIVASPCTAPFMGTALTFAISQPNIVGFVIFTSLGLGLALPFVVLSAFPFLLSFIPRPGAWMIYLKKGLGVILLACVLWLVWVFGIQTGLGDLSKFIKPAQGIHWLNYSATAVSQARQAGHGVFIDFTADWCINCQVNDRLVLQNSEVIKVFKDKEIVPFKADWTKYDPLVTQALRSFGRDSIPVYVYFPPGINDPKILPQLITPRMIVKSIKSANSKGENDEN